MLKLTSFVSIPIKKEIYFPGKENVSVDIYGTSDCNEDSPKVLLCKDFKDSRWFDKEFNYKTYIVVYRVDGSDEYKEVFYELHNPETGYMRILKFKGVFSE